MLRDVEALIFATRVLVGITAFAVTLFPLLYGIFSIWYKSQLGIAVMLQSVSIALTVDYSAVRRIIFPDTSEAALVVYLVLLSFVCLTSLFLTFVLVYLNFTKPRREEYHDKQGV